MKTGSVGSDEYARKKMWKIPWTEGPVGLQFMGSLGVGHDFTFTFHFSLSCIGEGNGNPLQCFCLENPRDGGAWWAAVCGVTQSRTWLKGLSSSSMPLRCETPPMDEFDFSFFDLIFLEIAQEFNILSTNPLFLPSVFHRLSDLYRFEGYFSIFSGSYPLLFRGAPPNKFLASLNPVVTSTS